MGYKTGSLSRSYNAAQGGDWSVTIVSAGSVGDVFLAVVSHDIGTGGSTNGVSSPNISWQLAEQFPHTGNNQNFEMWIGRVTTAFNANTESVTVDISVTDASYRDLTVAGWAPEAGYEFPSSGYFVDATSITYASGYPTGTDGYSTTPNLGGVNAKWLLIAWLNVEDDDGSLASASSGTDYTQREEYAIFDTSLCPANLADRIYDGSTSQAITATYSQGSMYAISLVGVAVKQNAIGGTPSHARAYGPQGYLRTLLTM